MFSGGLHTKFLYNIKLIFQWNAGVLAMIARQKGGLFRSGEENSFHNARIWFPVRHFEAKLMARYYYYGSAAII